VLVDARDHVDEIVVVDQMSTDGTAEIAQRLATSTSATCITVTPNHRGSCGIPLIGRVDPDPRCRRAMSELLKANSGLVERDADGF